MKRSIMNKLLVVLALLVIGCNHPTSSDDDGRVSLTVTTTQSYGTSSGKWGARGYVTNNCGTKVYNVVLEAPSNSWSREVAASLAPGGKASFDTGYMERYSSLVCTARKN